MNSHHFRGGLNTEAFVTPAGANFISSKSSPRNGLPRHRRHRAQQQATTQKKRYNVSMNVDHSNQPPPRRIAWPKALLLTAGTALTTTFGVLPTRSAHAVNSDVASIPPQTTVVSSNRQSSSSSRSLWTPLSLKSSSSSSSFSSRQATLVASSSTSSATTSEPNISIVNSKKAREPCLASSAISLEHLGIKRDEFLSDRELRRHKTTQFSEAEEEIMELEEWEVDTQWFRDMQTMWAAIFSIGGIFVLYRGGVMWENWIKEQEQKDMEEEIELTGTFIDPRAVRKDEDDNGKDKGTDSKKPPSGDKPDEGSGDGDLQQGGDIESLEKLFGKS